MAPPTGYPNPFSIFGRPRQEQPADFIDDEDAFDDADEDYNPNAQDMEQGEYDDEIETEDQLDPEEEIDNTGDIDGEDVEEVMDDQFEEGDEEMHDRGTVSTIMSFAPSIY